MSNTITVIIPTFNEEKELPATLKSVVNQDRIPDEIIVVDSKSTDKTQIIAKKFGAKIIVCSKRGIGLARQKGLEQASGKIVAYLDADTLAPKNWLSQIEFNLNKPGIVGVVGIYTVPDGWWIYRYYINYIWPLIIRFFNLFGKVIPAGQNMAFYKKIGLAVGGFPIDFKMIEDLEMVRRLKSVGEVIQDNTIVVTSSGRRGQEGLSGFWRNLRAFTIYFFTRRANSIGFPDIR